MTTDTKETKLTKRDEPVVKEIAYLDDIENSLSVLGDISEEGIGTMAFAGADTVQGVFQNVDSAINLAYEGIATNSTSIVSIESGMGDMADAIGSHDFTGALLEGVQSASNLTDAILALDGVTAMADGNAFAATLWIGITSDDTAVSFTGDTVGSCASLREAVEALDVIIGQIPTVGYILDGNQSNVGEALAALDSAFSETGSQIADLWAKVGSETFEGTTYASEASNNADAILHLDLALASVASNAAIDITSAAGSGSGVLTTYTITQGGNEVGTIDIPKDFLVKSAALSTVTTADTPYTGAHVGDKYIDFVINAKDASETAEHIYLPVNDLVDVYTTQQSATQVQLAIDSSNVISATLVAGGVTDTELASSAVTTAKIADGAVTTAKIGLVDTADSSKVYTLSVTGGRLQLVEVA